MLEHVPGWLGQAMKGMRAGSDKLCIAQGRLGTGFGALRLASPAFANGGTIPVRFTADGEGVSPPLLWDDVPQGTQSLALIVEDPDAPSPQPLVHAIVWHIDPAERSLPEGDIRADGTAETGRNSFLQSGWLPPDPPTGHGAHHYAFQLFALSAVPNLGDTPGRSALLKEMEGKVLAAGLLSGRYSRGEEAMRPLATAAATPQPGGAPAP